MMLKWLNKINERTRGIVIYLLFYSKQRMHSVPE